MTGQVAITMAMVALGYQTRLEALRSLGVKPFVLALCLFAMLVVGGGVATSLILG